MIFIFANFVGNAIEQLHELPVIRFGVSDADSARYWWPSLRHFFEFGERHVIPRDRLIGPLINLTSMADIVQKDAALLDVELVKDAVIAHSQLEFGSALKSAVREVSQSCSHLVHLALHCITDGCWKGIECFGERRRPNL